jgi:hypothetical protein
MLVGDSILFYGTQLYIEMCRWRGEVAHATVLPPAPLTGTLRTPEEEGAPVDPDNPSQDSCNRWAGRVSVLLWLQRVGAVVERRA